MSDKKKNDDWRREYDRFFNFEEMDTEFEAMRRYMDQIMESIMRGDISQTTVNPFVYGFSLRVGPDGQPHIEKFGNTQVGQGQEIPGTGDKARHDRMGRREPLTDVIESEECVSITVEIPGVEKEDVNLEVQNNNLVISVDTETHRYFKEVALPSAVDPESAKATYNNGVLDIVLKKLKHEKKSTRITVE